MQNTNIRLSLQTANSSCNKNSIYGSESSLSTNKDSIYNTNSLNNRNKFKNHFTNLRKKKNFEFNLNYNDANSFLDKLEKKNNIKNKIEIINENIKNNLKRKNKKFKFGPNLVKIISSGSIRK